jgi:hypothetical protein
MADDHEAVTQSDEDIKKLAVDIFEGRVFGSWCIPESELSNVLHLVFLPLAFTDRDQIPKNTAHFYEYLRESSPRGINGYPSFFSVRFMSRGMAETIYPMLAQLEGLRKSFLESSDTEGSPNDG